MILNKRLKGQLIKESSIPIEALYNNEVDKVRALDKKAYI
jgi:hypothetical protein